MAVFCHEGDEAGHRPDARSLACPRTAPNRTAPREGTGALYAYPLLQSAVRMLNEMNNFENAHITK